MRFNLHGDEEFLPCPSCGVEVAFFVSRDAAGHALNMTVVNRDGSRHADTCPRFAANRELKDGDAVLPACPLPGQLNMKF